MVELNNFDSIQISLASPEQILEWSHGEVRKPETINYRTLKPEKDGLFCERIFGPTKDWECHCGKYKRVRYKGMVCDKCGVEITRSKVRRERMGHIMLAAPVSHIWYFKGIPSRMGLLLDLSPRSLERVLYFAAYIVLDPGETDLTYKQVISDREYMDAVDKFGRDSFRAGMGAESVKELLKAIDLEEESEKLREEVKTTSGQKKVRAVRRLEVVEAFRKSGNKPEWIILDVVPVIPPEIRPMVQLDGGRFATSDLNDLYRRVINRNNRLKRLLELKAPDIIVRNEKRMLQEAVDALIDNGRRGRPVTGPGNRPLKSLSDMLRGKQGRFRQNLLGKRVDYSGRSVIVVGPELKIYQCGLPKEMALELFKPFVLKKLVEENHSHNVRQAKKMVERLDPRVWDVLEDIIKDHPVLLNRAPTLHRLGIQAFEPVLVEGRALRIHPLVCTAYNADFDGDQMAVHIPLSVEAQAECRFLMLSVNNMLKPQDGKPVVAPIQDMVMGVYYLTLERDGCPGEGAVFADENEAVMAYQTGYISLHAKIKVRREGEFNGEKVARVIDTTAGKIIFNRSVPQDMGFVDRDNIETFLDFEISDTVDKKGLDRIIDRCYHLNGTTRTALVLDEVKSLGFSYSTRGAVTISVSDLTVPEEKATLLADADEQVEEIEEQFNMGLLSEIERKESVVRIWNKTTKDVTNALMDCLDEENPVYMMAISGARGSTNQIRQLAGMRGLMADPSGEIIEVPIRANFREGLTVLEYFISTHGARKGLADTALRTADSGYLTRRLVDVSQEVIVREDDCFEAHDEPIRGITLTDLKNGNEIIEPLADRIIGRNAAEDIVHPETGEVIVKQNDLITATLVDAVIEAGVTEVQVRSVLTCRALHGVCAKCYGSNLASGDQVPIGDAVGIIAAQSIGEPGTQLTMRTFHTGGVASADDITQGLPRVEELFEARKPKGLAVITEISGKAEVIEGEGGKKKREVIVSNDEGESETYTIPFNSRVKVRTGDELEAGQELTEGPVNPHDILKIKGIKGAQQYLLREVQAVYRMQGVEINDRHIEVIIRQMLRKVRIENSGDTNMLPGELVDVHRFERENEAIMAEGNQTASAKYVLMGITKASLATDSFLSAASFQETTRVLTEAAIKGKTDPLMGLKENVIIGKLIPAGTGLRRYKDIEIRKVGNHDFGLDYDMLGDISEDDDLLSEITLDESSFDQLQL